MQPYQKAFIDFLLEAGALRIGAFKLKSGRTSPLFLNTGLLDTGSRLARVGSAFASTLMDRLGKDGFDVVFGPAYKGIPLGVATSIALSHDHQVDKAALSDRKEAKAHGAEASGMPIAKRLLGRPPAENARFVMVDDVLTTGGTKVEALDLLRQCAPKGKTVALLVVLDRQETTASGEDAVAKFSADTGVPVVPVVTLTDTLDYLQATGRLPASDLERCREYWGTYGTSAAKAWAEAQTV
jgi:orotate phosphoribosyltransferase